MTKEEVIRRSNELFVVVEEIKSLAANLLSEIRALEILAEELPDDVNQIENSNEDEG